jgi:dienelactone hydrolase
MIEKTVEYVHNGATFEAYMAVDGATPGPRPAILIAHTWEGRGEFVCDKARNLAGNGYVGFAIDLYGQGVVGSSPEQNAGLMQPFLDDRKLLQSRMNCALQALLGQPEVERGKVAAIGYCFGGMCVLDLARVGADVRSVVSLHGLLGSPGNTLGNKIAAKVLILHGSDDPMAPIEDVAAVQQELTTAGADWQLHAYGNTMHSFTNPNANNAEMGTVYNEVADHRSWKSLISFLEETLG